jgi:dTDP-4-dehydrorhamnose 3,5-epimerase
VPKSLPMQKLPTALPGVWQLLPKVFRDKRGYFSETYHQQTLRDLGIEDTFVQDNHSFSHKGVLRGLHYQLNRPQAKLCRVVQGKALDVVVDVRVGSQTWGKYITLELSAEAHNQIYIPAGFAHGFLALEEPTHFLYKCSDYHYEDDERGILWKDPMLDIPWGVTNPVLSLKDERHKTLERLRKGKSLPPYAPK